MNPMKPMNPMNPMNLVDLLKGHNVYIQTHNFPDQDAIGSAFGLQKFLQYHGVKSTLFYDGKIDKLTTKRMVNTIGVEFDKGDELDSSMTKDDYVVTIDCQKLNANRTDYRGNEVACIDHHPEIFPYNYQYADIRKTGACASIIASYYQTTNTPMEVEVATALAYAIKMDTAEFTRGVTDLDVDMFAYVFKLADKAEIQKFYTNVMEFEDLRAYGAAIETIEIYENVGFANLSFDCPDALVAIISDFILSLNIIEISIIYAEKKGGLKFSVRSERKDINAGKLVHFALGDIGSAGGHKSMAGAFIPKEKLSMLEPDIYYNIKNRFISVLEEKKDLL